MPDRQCGPGAQAAANEAVEASLRSIPSVSRLLGEVQTAGLLRHLDAPRKTRVVRTVLGAVRAEVMAGHACPDDAGLLSRVIAEDAAAAAGSLRRIINATGIPLHTNLGRAPIARAVMDRVVPLVTGYCNLEFDLTTGQRGVRAEGVLRMLEALTGAEAAAVTNNGAAAVCLAMQALASGRSVLVSRGELVQIGGGFRVPDIITAGGARLVEVGTTNITRIDDYRRALTPEVALILRVHRSNFHLVGHVEEPTLGELSALARAAGVPLVVDLGSGALVRWPGHDPAREPTVQDVLRAGADLVLFSGDKLLGGPQAGILAGRSDLVGRCARHPLYRALRCGRLVTATLQESLRDYLAGKEQELPIWRMINAAPEELHGRVARFVAALGDRGIPVEMAASEGTVGGGAAPDCALPAPVARLRPADASAVQARLRQAAVPVITRVDRSALLVDLRTVAPEDEASLEAALAAAWQ